MFNLFSKTKKIEPIFLTNTLSGKKEKFSPLTDNKVRMYNCGPTVYSKQHIGNMRPYVFADILRRMLEYNNYTVQQVINITDVGHLVSDGDDGEDKMEKRAKESGRKAEDIAEEITQLYFNDLDALNIKREAIEFPRATAYIAEQILMIQTLEQKGYTYKTSDGIYFDTSKFLHYGKLGNIDIVGLREGARVDKNDEKKNLTDFALWKFSGEAKRQQEWDSPWGVGFPGWHIECSAMARSVLGAHIDIHTGGIDHIPVHHNNEIAQSECTSGHTFANYWMHNAHIMIDGKKISKSLGNDIYLSDFTLKELNPLALRYLYLGAHYATQLNFTWDSIKASNTTLKKLQNFAKEHQTKKGTLSKKYEKLFHTAINDDLDTPKALAITWEMLKDTLLSDVDKYATLIHFDTVLGLGLLDITIEEEQKIPKKIQELLNERADARKKKDWELSDKLRDEIRSQGYTVKDTADKQEVSKP